MTADDDRLNRLFVRLERLTAEFEGLKNTIDGGPVAHGEGGVVGDMAKLQAELIATIRRINRLERITIGENEMNGLNSRVRDNSTILQAIRNSQEGDQVRQRVITGALVALSVMMFAVLMLLAVTAV